LEGRREGQRKVDGKEGVDEGGGGGKVWQSRGERERGEVQDGWRGLKGVEGGMRGRGGSRGGEGSGDGGGAAAGKGISRGGKGGCWLTWPLPPICHHTFPLLHLSSSLVLSLSSSLFSPYSSLLAWSWSS
jgi:hypothetical protein